MKKYLSILLVTLLYSCSALVDCCLKPSSSEFTNRHSDEYTGLDSLININGYFCIKDPIYHLNRPYYYSIMFYSDNIVCSTSDNVLNTFVNRTNPGIIWGTYEIVRDTIQCQFVMKDYVLTKIGVTKKTFLIKSKNELLKIEGSNIENTYTFHPLENRMDSTNWLLKKRWFNKKKK